MRIIKIDEKRYNDFVMNCPYRSYYQSSSYGRVMNNLGLKDEYYGFEDGGQLVGVTLVLVKTIFMNFKYGYCPRGIIMDYTQARDINEVTRDFKAALLKDYFLMIKMDPLVISSIRDKRGSIKSQNNNLKSMMSIMEGAGYNHCGFNMMFEAVKTRFEAELNIDLPATTLFKNLSKQTRNKLRKATKYGLTVYKDNKYEMEKYFHLIKDRGFNLKYYKELHNNFGDNFEIYYAKLNTRVYVENSKKLYEKEMEINDYLTNIIQSHGYKGKKISSVLSKKMESDKLLSAYKSYMVVATELLREYPEGLIVGVTTTLKYADKIYLVTEGYNREYKNLCATYLTKWKIIEKYAQSEMKVFNMGGLSGRFDPKNNPYKGLNEMKFGYGCQAIEYVGEFNLIVNNPMYSIYKGLNLNKK